jgi:hypothetical protein
MSEEITALFKKERTPIETCRLFLLSLDLLKSKQKTVSADAELLYPLMSNSFNKIKSKSFNGDHHEYLIEKHLIEKHTTISQVISEASLLADKSDGKPVWLR